VAYGGRNHDVGRYHSLNHILARPPRRDLTMPHGHDVDNCSLRFCRKGRQLDLGESRSPTQIFQRNLLPASHRLWAYVCAFGPGLMVMMAKVMMAMVMVSVMVIIVPEALKTSRLATSTLASKLPQTQSFPSAKSFPWKTLLLPKRGSLKQALKQALKHQRALKQTLSDNVQYRYNSEDSRQWRQV
jgi:hypothetical protein